IKKPKILLADEPTASLDRENKEKIMDIFKKFTNEGGTVVMVTHDLELIDEKIQVIRLNNH
ncbi:AAA family ATPase, partial [Escherichia coli]|nr:AAA family ATPase [Escherichia coli]